MSALAAQPADLVLTGGRIATMDPARSWVSALVVHDGRIAAVGTDHEVRPHIGPSTRVIELRGRTVTPGFQDAHVHPVSAPRIRARRPVPRPGPARGPVPRAARSCLVSCHIGTG